MPTVGKSMIVCLLLASAECGRRELQLGRVSGRVSVDGQPVTGGIVYFVPERGPSAAGAVDNQGRFTLTSRFPADGAVVGRHQVYFGPPPARLAKEMAMSAIPPPEIRHDFPPEKYLTPETSGLTVEVMAGENVCDFDLKLR